MGCETCICGCVFVLLHIYALYWNKLAMNGVLCKDDIRRNVQKQAKHLIIHQRCNIEININHHCCGAGTIRWRVVGKTRRKKRHVAASYFSDDIHKQGMICSWLC